MFKRAICLISALAVIFAFTGCKDGQSSSSTLSSDATVQTSGDESTDNEVSNMPESAASLTDNSSEQTAPANKTSSQAAGANSTVASTSKVTSAQSSVTSKAPSISPQAPSSPLYNTHKLLTSGKKQLTIGYLGGSITLGVSAQQRDNGDGTFSTTGGDLMNSWVNRTSTWFKNTYPQASIETVNAGVSDTATNFGIFRLEKTLMNTNGHRMPDLVFVEFTRNDWTYETQSAKDLERQAESLVRNIYSLNPNAEIVFIITARAEKVTSRLAYIAVAEKYGIPTVDVGIPLQKKMTERGASEEKQGTYYYTVDNLHPSAEGYKIFAEEIQKELKKHLNSAKSDQYDPYPRGDKLPAAVNTPMMTNPKILTASDLTKSGKIQEVASPVGVSMYGTGMIQTQVSLTPSYLHATGNATVSCEFTGTALGVLFKMNTSDINMRYRIDDGDWKIFQVNDESFGFQRRNNHQQVYMLAHTLSAGKHKVQMVFSPSGTQAVNVMLAGVLVAG